jgi:hypothetical protein
MIQIIFICKNRLSKSLRRPLISTLPETRFSGRVLHNQRLPYLVHPYLSGHFLKEYWLLSNKSIPSCAYMSRSNCTMLPIHRQVIVRPVQPCCCLILTLVIIGCWPRDRFFLYPPSYTAPAPELTVS